MLPQEIIRKKRDSRPLSTDELQFFSKGIADGSISEGQIAAFGMAVFLNGMSNDEAAALTLAMRDTGDVLCWDGECLNGPVIDKHSTGGVGDGVSLMLGPVLAACGGYVPMISGRGLGHTGGTLDKLEAIPGYNTTPNNALFRKTVRDCGVSIIGQTGNLAPADKRFYATRDITATVESIPLITASILSKQLAAGLDYLVMDVKTGNGAFMPTHKDSQNLAQSIADVATAAGVKTTALLTDMNQPLGSSAGNSVEVREAIRFLTGEHQNPRLREVTFTLCAELLQLSDLVSNKENAHSMLEDALSSGAAAEKFNQMVHSLGGPDDIISDYDTHLPTAPFTKPVFAKETGIITAIDTRALGMTVVTLGGGRKRADDSIDHSVGLTDFTHLGATTDQPLAVIHARSEDKWTLAAKQVQSAIQVSDTSPNTQPVVHQIIQAQ